MLEVYDLITSLCPEGVNHESLGKLGTFYGGLSGKTKQDFENGNARYISYMNVYNNPAINTNISDFVSIAPGEKQNQVRFGDILFTGSSETKEECAISSVLTDKEALGLYLNSFCFGYRFNNPDLFLPEFSKYLFRSESIRRQLIATASGVTRYNVSKEKMAKVSVPVPPIKVQQIVVDILDEYTKKTSLLVDRLEAELDFRKIQLPYYIQRIFDNETSGAQELTIQDVCIKTSSGGTPKTSHNEYYGGEIPWLRTQEVNWKDIFDTEIKITQEGLDNSSAKLIPANCVIVAMYGATAGKSAINRIPLTTNQACCNLQINEQIAVAEYVYLWLVKEYKRLKALGRGSQDNLNSQMIKSFPIILPNIEKQNRIVAQIKAIEDKYRALNDSIANEIYLRRQQMAYYIDYMTTFSMLHS